MLDSSEILPHALLLLSWPHLMRPSRAAGEVLDLLVDSRVKPGHDDYWEPMHLVGAQWA